MRRFLLILLFFPMFICSAHAQEIISEAVQMSGINELNELLPSEVKEISGEIAESGIYDSTGALKRLWLGLLDRIKQELKNNVSEFLSLFALCIFCALSLSICQSQSLREYINIAGICAAASLFTGSIDGMVNEVISVLNDMDMYSKAALPAIFMAASAGGAVIGGSARYAAASMGIDVIMNTAKNAIVPLMYGYIALSVCKGMFDQPLVKSILHFIKWLSMLVLSAMTIVFGAYISITGIISGSVDAFAVKTARTIISNGLPVVGGMISDAASTVLSAAQMIKASAGALSLVAVCAICIGPFTVLSVKMLLFKVLSAACEMLPGNRVSTFLGDIGTALGILLGLLGSICIMLFVSFTSAIKVVTG